MNPILMKYTSEGVPEDWDGKDWQTYQWGMITVFKENDLKDIAVGDLTKAMLATASAENQEEFAKKQLKIMRRIGTSVPPEVFSRYATRRPDRTCGKSFAICMKGIRTKQSGYIRFVALNVNFGIPS